MSSLLSFFMADTNQASSRSQSLFPLLPTYLFCIIPLPSDLRFLDTEVRDYSKEFGIKYNPYVKLPVHLTISPPFSARQPERLISDVDGLLTKFEYPSLYTQTLDVFAFTDKNEQSRVVVFRMVKDRQLQKLHELVLSAVERHRIVSDKDVTENERRFGSNYVLNNYSPHISLFKLPKDQQVPDSFQRKIDTDYHYPIGYSGLTLLKKEQDPSAAIQGWMYAKKFLRPGFSGEIQP